MTARTNEENDDDGNDLIENSTANEYEQKAYEQKLLFKTALDEYSENLLKTQTNVSITETDEERENSKNFRIQMAKLAAQGNVGLRQGTNKMESLSRQECGGVCERYRWEQDEGEITIKIEIASDCKGRECKVLIRRNKIECRVRDLRIFSEELGNTELFADVIVDDSTWEIIEEDDDDDERAAKKIKKFLEITLLKKKKTLANKHWSYVTKGEPTIDVEKFGPPVVGVNERNPMDTERMREMFEEMRPKK